MQPYILITVYCVTIAAAAFAGGMLPSTLRLTHTRMQLIMSFVGGLVLGVGLLHLLPHSLAATGSMDKTVYAALVGLLAMFFLIRIFHVHQHGPVDQKQHAGHVHHDCEHDHRHDYPLDGEQCVSHGHTYGWIGLFAGLALHTMIDGMALAASVAVELHAEDGATRLAGLGTFLAVLLHKPMDAMSITSVMAAGGWSVRAQRVVNLIFALMCAVGAAAFYLGVERFADNQQAIVGLALGFAGGVFLCISLADILPEVQFHRHDRVALSTALVLGIGLAVGIGFVEPEHRHDHGPVTEHEYGAAEDGHEDQPSDAQEVEHDHDE